MIKKATIRKIFIGLAIAFVIAIGSAIAFSLIYKDQIIAFFLEETNKSITTPIDVEKIDISLLSEFPHVSISLHNVTIKESSNNHREDLGKAKLVNISFNLIDIINRKFDINGIHLYDGTVKLQIDKEGVPNYLFFKKDSTSRKTMYALKNVTAENLDVLYLDEKSDFRFVGIAQKITAELKQENKILLVNLAGDLLSDEIKIKNRVFFNNKSLNLMTDFEVDLKNKIYSFKPSSIQVDKGKFVINGDINQTSKYIDLKVEGQNTSFQSINSLLSGDIAKHFQDYRSKGKVYFNGTINGEYKGKQTPRIDVDFGANNASFFHPEYKRQITEVNLNGMFSSGAKNDLSTFRLDIRNFSCALEDKKLEGGFTIENFNDHHIDLVLRGEADVNTLLLLFPGDYVKTAFGNLKLDIHLNGKLKNPKLTKNLDANGEIEFKNISLALTGRRLPINKLNGSFMLRNNDLAISNFNGYVGNSDFQINGFIKDISTFLSQKNKKYKMQADLQSKFIDFDELLKSNFASRDTTKIKNSTYEFRISPKLDLDFNCKIDNLRFRRFTGRQIIGQVEIKDQIAVLKNVAFSSMGGNLRISGSVNNKQKNLVETISEASLSDINVDSVFYVFKNFNQNWLIDRNLKGQLEADINLYMNFDKNLVLNSRSLVADINTSIVNGELNDFQPMMELSKFVEEESLEQMRFSRMTNEIKIENRTIYLPEMEIRSNVSNILVSGIHTFDNNIEYHFSVPLKSFIRISKKKDFEQSARHGMNLLLKLAGHTSDYKISYDTKALKDNIKKDFLDEGKEWRNLKKKDTLIEKEVPELEEEYFEFEEESPGEN